MDDEAPLAQRRTPRKSIQPSRLGIDDDWAEIPAGKWTPGHTPGKTPKSQRRRASTPKAEIPEPEAVVAPVVAPAKAAAPDEAVSADVGATVASMVEGALLSGIGNIIQQRYIAESASLDMQRILSFAVWGAIVTLFVAPYTKWITSFKLSDSALFDGAMKSVLNQFLLNMLLVALFIVYNALMTATLNQTDYPSHESLTTLVQANFYDRWTQTASFWLGADAINLIFVPADFQTLYGAVASVVWGGFHSTMPFKK